MTDLEIVRKELLERGDEMVSFQQLVERFDSIEAVYPDQPWNLEQIYSNFNILIGKEPERKVNRMIQIDMEMPKCCTECPIPRYIYGQEAYCPFVHENNLNERTDRPSECPLKEIEKSEDCVNRKAAIDACLRGLSRREMMSNIKTLPPVTSTEKPNKWVDIKVIEKIRAEIKSKAHPDYTGHNEYEMNVSDGYEGALKIIDKHISSTDGEQI